MVSFTSALGALGLAILPASFANVLPTTTVSGAMSTTASTSSTVLTKAAAPASAQILVEEHGPNYSGALAPTPVAPPADARTTPKAPMNPGVSTPIGGQPGPGIMKKGATASILAPTGWSGRVSFNEADKRIQGDESLIEAGYTVQTKPWPYGVVDVSYVDGYTLPIICKCRSTGAFTGGCIDPKLWQQSLPCPNDNGQGACKNPHRGIDATEAHPWFAPCAGRAYTFDADNTATHNGICQSGTVDCEIHPR
ncbi:hypothetical protein QBC44DRAFT_363689 [Cladorrhinum sp. PSN332]|nr:hypothetical protein QBC44DRAFT_363689 [Cladorrhinum sp. PSN332]